MVRWWQVLWKGDKTKVLVIAGIVFAGLAAILLGLLALSWGDLTKLGRTRDAMYIMWAALLSIELLTEETWLLILALIPIAVVAALLALKLLGKIKCEN